MFSSTNNVYFATGNNSQKEFTFPFQFQSDGDVIVKILNEVTMVVTTLGSLDYSISNRGLSGGTINLTFNSQAWMDIPTENLRSGFKIMIKREPFINQTTDFRNAGRFLAEQHEDRFDRQTYFDQDLSEQLVRTAQFDEFAKYDNSDLNPSLPRPVDGKFLRWEGINGELVNSDFGLDALQIALQVAMEAYADAGDVVTLIAAETFATAGDVATLSAAEAASILYTDQAEIDAVTTSNAYTDSEIALLTSASVGLGNVDNTSDLNKPISTDTQTALDLKANSSHTHPLTDLQQSGAIPGQIPEWDGVAWVAASPVSGVTDHSLLSNLAADDHTQYLNNARGDARYYTETETDTLLATNATDDRSRANHTGTQTLSTLAQSGATVNQVPEWSGSAWVPVTPTGGGAVTSVAGKTGIVTLVPTDVGLANVDNTSDVGKPVSTAQQTALDLKANLASPTFTGTVVLPSSQIVNGITLSTSAGISNFLRGDGTYGAGGTYTHPNHSGDVTSVGDGAQTIINNAVTNAKAADMPTNTIKGNNTGISADPIDLTAAQTKALLAVEPIDLINTETVAYNREHESRVIAYDDNSTGAIYIRAVHPMMARTAHISWWVPGLSATTANIAGMAAVVVQGTITGKTPTNQTSDLAKAIPRIGYRVSVAATTAIASWRSNSNNYYVNGQGSLMLSAFTSTFIFGPDTGSPASSAGTLRCFAGYSNATGTPTDINPNALGAQVLGVGARNTDTNWHVFVRRTGVDTQIIDTGIPKAFSAEDADMYQLIIESLGGRLGSGVRIAFRQLGTNFISNEFITTIVGTDLPPDNQLLSPRVQYSVGGTSSIIGVSIAKFYSEQYYGAYGYL